MTHLDIPLVLPSNKTITSIRTHVRIIQDATHWSVKSLKITSASTLFHKAFHPLLGTLPIPFQGGYGTEGTHAGSKCFTRPEFRDPECPFPQRPKFSDSTERSPVTFECIPLIPIKQCLPQTTSEQLSSSSFSSRGPLETSRRRYLW